MKSRIKLKREKKRLARLRKAGRLVKGIEVPEGALAGNPDEQKVDSLGSTKFFYRDIAYTCAGCGKEGVWSVEQQKRYFEIQKRNIYNQPKWCYECHVERMRLRHEGS